MEGISHQLAKYYKGKAGIDDRNTAPPPATAPCQWTLSSSIRLHILLFHGFMGRILIIHQGRHWRQRNMNKRWWRALAKIHSSTRRVKPRVSGELRYRRGCGHNDFLVVLGHSFAFFPFRQPSVMRQEGRLPPAGTLPQAVRQGMGHHADWRKRKHQA